MGPWGGWLEVDIAHEEDKVGPGPLPCSAFRQCLTCSAGHTFSELGRRTVFGPAEGPVLDPHVLLRRLRGWEGQRVRAGATATGLRGPTGAAPSLCPCDGGPLAGGGRQAGGAPLLGLRFLEAALVLGAALRLRTVTRKPQRE